MRCASLLADRNACIMEVDEDGDLTCKFVESESNPSGYCVVNAANEDDGTDDFDADGR